MTHRDFTYWLRGYFEVSNATSISRNELSEIKRHLYLVNQFKQKPIHKMCEEFCDWLEVYFENNTTHEYNNEQTKEIRHKLDLMFYIHDVPIVGAVTTKSLLNC